MYFFLLFLVFLSVVLFSFCIFGIFFSSRANTVYRLKKYAADENTYTENQKAQNINQGKQLLRIFGFLGKLLPQSRYFDKTKRKLIQASVLMKPEEFLGASIICAITLSLIIYLLFKTILLAVAFLGIGFLIPELIIKIKKSKRMAKINSELPEALNIISNGLRAGYGFVQALGIVSSEIEGPISEEFNKVIRDNSLGKPIEEALLNMSERTDDEDIDMAITAFIIQRQVGGNLAEVLDTISQTIRERVKIKNDIKTLTAQGRVSAVIVSLMPFVIALGLSLINPGYISVLFTTVIGRLLIGLGLSMQITGIIILIKLVDIKV